MLSNPLRADATAILVFEGPALVAVTWTIASGAGVVTPFAPQTDASGRAWARYDPAGIAGEAVIEVQHGT
ncbi:hypothetical protein CF68_33005 [Cupriavidus sp. SK-4]|uniref:hypothetical protein n=1 Tax=Cupriavidus sp. SK-4 TaxID=574750 RepID=UPI00044A9E46|nr:hypothetical protein [Cupriavidus sp. SK-4]EYS89523.1 hypothetical protein CF68_33005 [Cupriavidus sp. SK-4]